MSLFRCFLITLFMIVGLCQYVHSTSLDSLFISKSKFLLVGPNILSNDIQIRDLGPTAGNAVRIVYDSTNNVFYLNSFTGDIFKISVSNEGKAKTELFILGNKSHPINRVQGLLWHKNALFLTGNELDEVNKKSKGKVIKFPINLDGTPGQPVNLLTTENYASSNVLFDHNFSAICLNKTKDSLLIASGSRTDHGEVKDVDGRFLGMREEPLTSKIFSIPLNLSKEIILKNDLTELKSSGYIYCEGVRNEFDIASNAKGEIFGVENNGDRDDPEELNLLKKGKHYGFPWLMGGNINPQQLSTYNPAKDLLLPNKLFNKSIFYNDPSFPSKLNEITFEEPINNIGPDANWIRDPISSKFYASKSIATFTSHRSPLGLVFDTKNKLAAPYTSDGFVLAYSIGGASSGYLNEIDNGADICQIKFFKSSPNEAYQVSVKRIAIGFKDLVDAVLVSNKMYVIQNDGQLYELTFPTLTSKPSISISSSTKSIMKGDKVEFTAIAKDLFEAPEFSWRINGKEVFKGSSIFTTNTLSKVDSVSCYISNYYEDGSQVFIKSNKVQVDVKPPFVQPSLTKSSNCIGATLTIVSNPMSKLIWKKDGIEVYNSTKNLGLPIENTLQINVAGKYMAEITTDYGDYVTNPIEIKDNPNAPTITLESDIFFISSEKWGNQWYKNSIALTGDTLQRYKVLQAGNYKVSFTNPAGCKSEFSAEKSVIILGTTTEKNELISIVPNPFSNEIRIQLPIEFGNYANIKIFDLNGSIVLSKVYVVNNEVLDLNYLASGTYLMNVESNDLKFKKTIKLLKN